MAEKRYKVLITNAEDNEHTTRELNKYKIDKTNMEIKATANKNIIIYLKRIADLDIIIHRVLSL